MCIIDEIQYSTHHPYHCQVCRISKHTKKDLLYILMLSSSLLCHEWDPLLEMLQAWVWCHCVKLLIYFFRSSMNRFSSPLDNVVFEDTLVELVKEVRCDTCKDVAVSKLIGPRWLSWHYRETSPGHNGENTSSNLRPVKWINNLDTIWFLMPPESITGHSKWWKRKNSLTMGTPSSCDSDDNMVTTILFTWLKKDRGPSKHGKWEITAFKTLTRTPSEGTDAATGQYTMGTGTQD